MLAQIRYSQQYRQVNQPQAKISDITTYIERDPITGSRSISTADGGIAIARYISNSIPNDVLALSIPSQVGLPGYISQKPY